MLLLHQQFLIRHQKEGEVASCEYKHPNFQKMEKTD